MASTLIKAERSSLVAERVAMTEKEAKVRTQEIVCKLQILLADLRPDSILAYSPFRAEPDILGFVLTTSAQIFLPKIVGPGTMKFYKIDHLSKLTPNRTGILEPSVDCKTEASPGRPPNAQS